MAPGIDTGDVIQRMWLPDIFPEKSELALEGDMMYRVVFGFIDPWVRAYALRELVTHHTEFAAIEISAQDDADAMTFHFMHSKLREVAMERMFKLT